MAIVYRNPYGELQTFAEQELALLRQERERLAQRLAEVDERERQFSEYLKAVAPLVEKDPVHAHTEASITKLCRKIIDSTPRWVTAQEVRATLKGMGMDISSYKNPMSVLYSILHRVAACHRNAEGKLYFGRRDLMRSPGSQVVSAMSLPQEEQSDGEKNARARPESGMRNELD